MAGTATSGPRSSRWWWMMGGGTAGAAVLGIVLMQGMRAETGAAATEPAPAKAGAKKPVEILARVGKDSIPYDAVAAECVDRYGKEILDDMINRLLIQQACQAQNVVVTEEEVNTEINRIAKRFNLDPAAWFSLLQAERNITPTQYRQSVIWPMIALRKLAGDQVEITDEDMHQAFVRNYGPRVKVKMIMFDNIRRANECWEKVNAHPEDFEKFAREYSIDANSRALGGAVPPIPRFAGDEDLEKAAFKLKAGEISGLIQLKTSQWVILQCDGRTEQLVTDIEEVRETLYEGLKEQKTQQQVGEVFDKIRKNARIDNYLTASSTGPSRAPTNPAIQQTSGSNTPGVVRPTGTPPKAPATARGEAPGRATIRE